MGQLSTRSPNCPSYSLHQPFHLSLWHLGILTICHPLYAPSSSRQKPSSGRWMRLSPCFKRCCDSPDSNPHNPYVHQGDGSNKIFCHKTIFALLFVCVGGGEGYEGSGS